MFKGVKNDEKKTKIVNPFTGREIKTNGQTYSILMEDPKIKEVCIFLENKKIKKGLNQSSDKQNSNYSSDNSKYSSDNNSNDNKKEKEEVLYSKDLYSKDIKEHLRIRDHLNNIHFVNFKYYPFITVRNDPTGVLYRSTFNKDARSRKKMLENPIYGQHANIEIIADADASINKKTLIRYKISPSVDYIWNPSEPSTPWLNITYTISFNHNTKEIKVLREGIPSKRYTDDNDNEIKLREMMIMALATLGHEESLYFNILEFILHHNRKNIDTDNVKKIKIALQSISRDILKKSNKNEWKRDFNESINTLTRSIHV